MACIVIAAVLTDRRALTVRNLALVGGVMLLFTPSLVYSAGYADKKSPDKMGGVYASQLSHGRADYNACYRLSFCPFYSLGRYSQSGSYSAYRHRDTASWHYGITAGLANGFF